MDNLNKLTKQELINIIRATKAELNGKVDEAVASGSTYSGDGSKNYSYSFGYLSSVVRNAYKLLDI
jgi:hypothetical protein